MYITTKDIETAISNHKEAAANNDMDPIVELDNNCNDIRNMLNKIQYMSNVEASAISEILVEVVEDLFTYAKH